ncbi:hypothetical protein EV122DRAFT_222428 [Schizophyllum commune]
MDALVDEDPELALEMVKLLGNGLKSVKAQLRDLQSQRATSAASVLNVEAARTAAECAELRERLRELEVQNEQLLAESHAPVKKEPYDQDDLLRQKEKIIQRQSDDLDKTYRELQKLKKENERLLQESEELQQTNSEIERNHVESEKVTAGVRQQAQKLQADLASSKQHEKALTAEIQVLKEPYAPSKFLKESRRAANSKQPVASELMAHGQPKGPFRLKPVRHSGPWPHMGLTTSSDHRVVALGTNEMFWPSKPADEISRAIAIYPAHVGDLANRDAGDAFNWTPQPIKTWRAIELFYQGNTEGWWLYMGTYICRSIATVTLPALPLDEYGIDIDKAADAVAAHAVNEDLVAPVLFKNMKTMFRQGLMQVCCLELECVGFNRRLYDCLLQGQEQAKAVGPAIKGAVSGEPAEHVAIKRKRKGSGDEKCSSTQMVKTTTAQHGRQKKKPKKS